MGAQVCESCEHKYDRNMNCYCSPNSTCNKYKPIKTVTEKFVDDNFVHEYNKVKIRNAAKNCKCKVCDKDISGQKVVYLKSFRLSGQPFHICIPCWKRINVLVEESEK